MPAASIVALIVAPAVELRGPGSPQRAHDASCIAHLALISNRAQPPAPKMLFTSTLQPGCLQLELVPTLGRVKQAVP